MSDDKNAVTARDETYSSRIATKIWSEQGREDNPYIAEAAYCHGYNLKDLVQRRSYIDVLYLLFRSELPNAAQHDLLQALMIAAISPGPRHAATRAAMLTGVGKSEPVHILPVSLGVLGGEREASAVPLAMRFINRQSKRPVDAVVQELVATASLPDEYDEHLTPGFGKHFGGVAVLPVDLLTSLQSFEAAGSAMAWTKAFSEQLGDHGYGCLMPAVVAACLLDLGFRAEHGAGLYQLFMAPGLLAHGQEMYKKPLTAMPFPTDDQYVYE